MVSPVPAARELEVGAGLDREIAKRPDDHVLSGDLDHRFNQSEATLQVVKPPLQHQRAVHRQCHREFLLQPELSNRVETDGPSTHTKSSARHTMGSRPKPFTRPDSWRSWRREQTWRAARSRG